MRKALQVLLGLFGTTAIFISLLHIAVGPASIPGSVPVNATMDSEDRFYAVLFLAFGVTLLWCIRDVERKARVVYFLMAVGSSRVDLQACKLEYSIVSPK